MRVFGALRQCIEVVILLVHLRYPDDRVHYYIKQGWQELILIMRIWGQISLSV
ncbi:hypothetical protein XF_0158 [Xylella fastidiosa 9a5c]|uniref:Uncharacterized protein n=1 Tax=Xylella fastidiosa (strain 9a5c) TaxID=160492 RepID=Q9PGY8_XYLFA|nr:hypothetical protein XF_0158 [Xylella fastidiosa 9a5c]